jgi:hypothetical protein
LSSECYAAEFGHRRVVVDNQYGNIHGKRT